MSAVFAQPLTGLHIARRDEHHRELVEAGIVPDNEKRVRGRADLLYDRQNRLSGCVVKPLDRGRRRRRTERGGSGFPGFQSARGGRRDHTVGDEGMGSHISADFCGVFPSTIHQFTGAVFYPRFGAFGLGVTKQQKSAHGHGMGVDCGRTSLACIRQRRSARVQTDSQRSERK